MKLTATLVGGDEDKRVHIQVARDLAQSGSAGDLRGDETMVFLILNHTCLKRL